MAYDMELTVGSPAQHCLVYPLRPLITPYEKHPHKVSVCPVRMDICTRLKGPDGHCIFQSSILLVQDAYIAVEEEKEVNELIRYLKMDKGMGKGVDPRCAEDGNCCQENGIGLEGNGEGIQETFTGCRQREDTENRPAGETYGKENPEHKDKRVYRDQPAEEFSKTDAGKSYHGSGNEQSGCRTIYVAH